MDATNGRPMSRDIGYRIEDVWDDMVRDIEERASTMEALSQRDVKDYRALQRVQVNTLFRDKLYHLYTAVLMESKARCARQAWGQAMDCNLAVHAKLQAYRVQSLLLRTQLNTTLRRIQTLEDREPARTDDPEDAGSSS
ncbi:hypothetical protein Tco_0961954 [Tanacetum coccineum]